MSRITVHRTEEGSWFAISRSVAQSKMSMEAIGLLVYLLSKPVNWKIRISELEQHFGIGKEKRRRVMAELESVGHLYGVFVRSEKGQVDGIEWHIYDEPKHKVSHIYSTVGEAGAGEAGDGFADDGKPASLHEKEKKQEREHEQKREIHKTENVFHVPEHKVIARVPVVTKDPLSLKSALNIYKYLFRETFNLEPEITGEEKERLIRFIRHQELTNADWKKAVQHFVHSGNIRRYGVHELLEVFPKALKAPMDRYGNLVWNSPHFDGVVL